MVFGINFGDKDSNKTEDFIKEELGRVRNNEDETIGDAIPKQDIDRGGTAWDEVAGISDDPNKQN